MTTMKLKWRKINNYELYLISTNGLIKSLPKTKHNGGKTNIIYLKKNISRGYIRYTLYKNGISKTFSAHRLVAMAFIPNPNNYQQINHKNGIKNDNRIENLEWCTQSHNTKHSYEKLNNIPCNRKLNNKQIKEIRNCKYYLGLYRDLSKKYLLSQEAISLIYNKKSYKNIK